jgi:adenylate kinase
VVACGLVYGQGEDLLFDWFKQAWLQEPAELKVMNEGLNHIPTVHVIDVARLIRKIITMRPARQYLLAVDKTIFSPNGGRENSKALNIVKSISTHVGSGKVTLVQAKTLLDSNPKLQ